MKYSEDIVKREIQMAKERNELDALVKDAPIGQLLFMLEIVADEIMFHEGSEYSKEDLIGKMVCRFFKDIEE